MTGEMWALLFTTGWSQIECEFTKSMPKIHLAIG